MRHSTVGLHRVRLLFSLFSAFYVYSAYIMDESKVREIVAHNNKELLSQIKDLVSSSISDLKRSSDANSAEQMSEIKRLKSDAPPSFNKKSNEDQYKATKCVLEAVEDASSSLERKDLPKTKEHLEKGMSLLKERQKLIVLADKSPYGWKTVLEYKHHDLAEDDEDEKKIYRAEARAARTSKRFAARGSNSQRRGSSVARSSQLAVAHLPNAFGRLNPQLSATRSAGICFSCGKPGHWRAACPNLLLPSSSQNQHAK